jgi:uncharacterized membrane protein YfhO
VIAPAAAILTSSEVALPGWRLQRNGEPWPLESDGTFLRWRLPAGVSRFELTFRPPMLRASLLLAAIGAVLFGLMCKIRET